MAGEDTNARAAWLRGKRVDRNECVLRHAVHDKGEMANVKVHKVRTYATEAQRDAPWRPGWPYVRHRERGGSWNAKGMACEQMVAHRVHRGRNRRAGRHEAR